MANDAADERLTSCSNLVRMAHISNTLRLRKYWRGQHSLLLNSDDDECDYGRLSWDTLPTLVPACLNPMGTPITPAECAPSSSSKFGCNLCGVDIYQRRPWPRCKYSVATIPKVSDVYSSTESQRRIGLPKAILSVFYPGADVSYHLREPWILLSMALASIKSVPVPIMIPLDLII